MIIGKRTVKWKTESTPPWEKLLTEPDEDEDEGLIEQAISIVRGTQRASASLLTAPFADRVSARRTLAGSTRRDGHCGSGAGRREGAGCDAV